LNTFSPPNHLELKLTTSQVQTYFQFMTGNLKYPQLCYLVMPAHDDLRKANSSTMKSVILHLHIKNS